MNTTHKSPVAPESFASGQIWELGDSNLQIGIVGKRLVHYKHYKGKTKRAPISIAAKNVLEKYLRENKAILIQA